MIMDDCILLLDYPLDISRALKEAEQARKKAVPYTDPRYDITSKWLIARYTSPFIDKIMMDFGVKGKPRFYFQDPYYQLQPHIDNGTTCSINFVLTDNPAPVTFGDVQYYYTQALLNTSVLHSVHNQSKERILLKISLFDISFEELSKHIKYKKETTL